MLMATSNALKTLFPQKFITDKSCTKFDIAICLVDEVNYDRFLLSIQGFLFVLKIKFCQKSK